MKFPALHNSSGITLIELMIVVSIIGVLAGLAAPNFSTLMAERAVAAETRRVISALKLARSEARARSSIVTLSRKRRKDWSGPIEIYVDVTADNHRRNGADDLVRKESGSNNRSVSAVDDQGSSDTWISFNMKGWLAESSPVLIAICSTALNDSSGMYVAINRVGKIRERQIGTDGKGCNP